MHPDKRTDKNPPHTTADREDPQSEPRHSADDVDDESPLESLGEAVAAPILDAADAPRQAPAPAAAPKRGDRPD